DVGRDLEQFLVKFSPPTSRSPVAAFVGRLTTEDDGYRPPRATPGANFVIPLAGTRRDPNAVTATDPPAAHPAPPAGGETAMTKPEPGRQSRSTTLRRRSRAALAIAFAIPVAGGVAWWAAAVRDRAPTAADAAKAPPAPIAHAVAPKP